MSEWTDIKGKNGYSTRVFGVPSVTRLEVIDQSGLVYGNYGISDVQIHLQDDGRTLKIFCKRGE